MSCFTSPVTFEIAVRARESGYQGSEMTYGAILDWIAAQKGVLVWIEFRYPRYYFARSLLPNKRIAHYVAERDTWIGAANAGIIFALSMTDK